MISRKPPSLATWLLEGLGHTRANPALAGDLLEEFAAGRSQAWYWRQALMVMVSGTARNARIYRSYFRAVLIGFAAQSAAAVALWWLHAPPRVHGVVWVISTGVLALSVFAALAAVKERVTGQTRANLQLLSCACEAGAPDRRTIRNMVAAETFVTYLMCYFIWALFWARPSGSELLSAQIQWLALWAMAPALVRVPVARRVPAEKAPAAAPTAVRQLPYPTQELSLLLTGVDGKPILLRPENVVASILAAADEELAAGVFQRAVSVEQLRRAIWLGSSRNYLAMLKDDQAAPPITTPRDFASLLEETARIDRDFPNECRDRQESCF